MGTWNLGAFANDDAADLLDAAGASPLRPVTAAMRAIADAPADAYLDVDPPFGAPDARRRDAGRELVSASEEGTKVRRDETRLPAPAARDARLRARPPPARDAPRTP